MKIIYLRIINFKQFYKEQYIEISDSIEKNVTIFHGDNGAGKTSLFTAINWCLYGVGIEDSGEILNKQFFIESEANTDMPVVVTVGFVHNHVEYCAERAWKFRRRDKRSEIISKEFLLSQVDQKGNFKDIANPEGVMDSILSQNVREYFFFDGEKMDDLMKPGNERITQAVQNIMKLPIIERTEDHLNKVKLEYRKAIKAKGSVELDLILDRKSEFEGQIEQLSENIEQKKKQTNLAEAQITQLEQQLENSKELGTLQSQRKDIERQLEKYSNLRFQSLSKIQGNANKVYPLFLACKADSALELINKQVEKGKIPSGIREQFLVDILNKGICICGRDFCKDDDAYMVLNSLLQSTGSSKLEDEVLNLRAEIRQVNSRVLAYLDILKNEIKTYYDVLASMEYLDKQKDEFDRRIGSADEVDLVAIDRTIKEFKTKQKLYDQEIGRSQERITQLEDQIEGINKRIEIEIKKEKELGGLNRREKLAEMAEKAVSEIKDKFYCEVRKYIESETKQVFDLLAWKQDHFTDIKLNDEFQIEVLDKWGLPTKSELSAGERQILSLAFISAMARLSGEESPIIMDTPFARLSSNHLTRTASNIPKLHPQLILFVTDTEWNQAKESDLINHISLDYNLVFHSDGCTTIEEGSFG